MKKIAELDVDFVGGQGSLTMEEELAISNFIQKNKKQSDTNSKIEKKKIVKKASA